MGLMALIIRLFRGEQAMGSSRIRCPRPLFLASDHARSSLSLPHSAREQLTQSLDAILAQGLPSEALPGRMTELLAQWRGGKDGGGRRRAVRLLGPPPTWARRPTCSLDPREHVTRCDGGCVMGGTPNGGGGSILQRGCQ